MRATPRPNYGCSKRFLADAFWRYPRSTLSRRETSLRLAAKICRGRLNPSVCAFLSASISAIGQADKEKAAVHPR